MDVVVTAFHPVHQRTGYDGDFFGVSLAHATAFTPGSHVFKVTQDPKTFRITDEIGPFVVHHVTTERTCPSGTPWPGCPHGQLTGMKYVYLTTHLYYGVPPVPPQRVWGRSCTLRVGDKIRVA